ncbi:MAG: hypothetical protein HPY74_19825 [Firmicutes bacterium]|nr:hypothetical protein [Bacillota bacterium]
MKSNHSLWDFSLWERRTSRICENGTVRAVVGREDRHGYKEIKYVWNGNMFVVVDEQ